MPTVTLERIERFEMTAASSDRTYDISLARPHPLAATGKMATDCPIMIVLDPVVTFGTAVERATLPSVMGLLESAVIVGVGYPGDLLTSVSARTVDMTPETPADSHTEIQGLIGSAFGGAERFLSFLVDELAPAIRARAPEASADRIILHGFSLSGLFATYALLARPHTFETVSSISPSLWWNDFSVLKGLEDFESRTHLGGRLPRVLIGVGSQEQDPPGATAAGMDMEAARALVDKARMVDAARELADTLGKLLPEVQFVAFEGEDHTGAATAGTGRAVRFALTPRPT